MIFCIFNGQRRVFDCVRKCTRFDETILSTSEAPKVAVKAGCSLFFHAWLPYFGSLSRNQAEQMITSNHDYIAIQVLLQHCDCVIFMQLNKKLEYLFCYCRVRRIQFPLSFLTFDSSNARFASKT